MGKKELRNILFEAAQTGNTKGIKEALEMEADVNWYDLNHWTALSWASYFNQLECVKLLVESGANLNHQNMYGYTPLSEAIYKEYWDIADFLLEKDANVNLSDHEGNNALMYFLLNKKDKPEIFQKLLQKTVNKGKANKKGLTAKELITTDYVEDGSSEILRYRNTDYYLSFF